MLARNWEKSELLHTAGINLAPKPQSRTVIRSSYTNAWYICKVLKVSIPHIQVHCGTIQNIHFMELAQVCIKGWI